MAAITAALIKDLRVKSGAGMMDCKKALVESDGNFDDAVDWLRKKGLSAAAKKADRVAAEGLVAVKADGSKGVAVEVNAETDFVARNDQFQGLVSGVADAAFAGGITEIAALASAKLSSGDTVEESITKAIATIGENMSLRRVQQLSVNEGIVSAYIHNAQVPGLGKIGVLVALESSAPADVLQDLGKKLAMHVAAASPQALNIADVDASLLDRERDVLSEQARASGKPEEIIAKMVEGRLRKYYEEVVLLEQVFVMDTDQKIKQVVEAAAKDADTAITLTGFVRYGLGEGIEKQETDFAEEVRQQVAAG